MTPCSDSSPNCDVGKTACRTVAARQRSQVTDEQAEAHDSEAIYDSAKVETAKEGCARGVQLLNIQVLENDSFFLKNKL